MRFSRTSSTKKTDVRGVMVVPRKAPANARFPQIHFFRPGLQSLGVVNKPVICGV